MRKTTTQKGFTLVELAIVMTIIGLLIGGILKGQELMQNARVTSTIAQVRSYEAATTTFRDKYDAIPGDMANAGARIPGCTGAAGVNCNPAANAAGATIAFAGDGIVGRPSASAWAPRENANGAQPAPANVAAGTSYEGRLFWTHMLLADLLSGVTNISVTGNAAAAWGASHPAAKIGGGFVAGFGDGTVTLNSTGAAGTGPSGMILIMQQTPVTTAANAVVAGQQPLNATRAAQIDRKMDDGLPNSGTVQTYGVLASCFGGAGQNIYSERVTSNDCGLVFRIQG